MSSVVSLPFEGTAATVRHHDFAEPPGVRSGGGGGGRGGGGAGVVRLLRPVKDGFESIGAEGR